MKQFSIEDQLKESFQMQSRAFYVEAIRFFNLYMLIGEHGKDALKRTPESFDFWAEHRDFPRVQKERIDILIEHFSKNETPPIDGEPDANKESFSPLLNDEEKNEDSALVAFLLRLLFNKLKPLPGINLDFLAISGIKMPLFDFKKEDGRCFLELSFFLYDLCHIYGNFFEAMKYPAMGKTFTADKFPNLIHDLTVSVYHLKETTARALCFWFPVDGPPEAFTGRYSGADARKEGRELRIEKLCEELKKYLKDGGISLSKKQWQAAVMGCNDGYYFTDPKTVKEYREETERRLSAKIILRK